MKRVILTDPAHDAPTRSLSYWVSGVLAHIDSLKGVGAVHLKGVNASSKSFNESIAKYDPKLVLFSGHGSDLSVCGHNDEALVSSNHESMELLNNRVIHALACKAGDKLGGELVQLGTIAFIGYKEDFQFFHLKDDGSDPVATLFLEPAYHVAYSLSSGETVERAHKESQKKYAKSLRMVLAAGQGQSLVAASLLHDIKNHVAIGDLKATI